ncbi:MAG: HEAT repeat domain-containing protein [Chloroflexi bacterium]|nr:HEAT repeat domain-containing protein [Chloroflexota bacterium]
MAPVSPPLARRLRETIGRAAEGDAGTAARLLAVLDTADPDAQAAVGAELDRVGDPRLWERLIELLAVDRWADRPVDVPATGTPEGNRLRRRARAAFVPHVGAPAEEARQQAILSGLRRPQPAIQAAAIDLAVLRGDRAAVGDLARLLFDADLPVREAAALALGRLGGAPAVEALIRSLHEEHALLSRFVTQALIQAGSEAVPHLITALASPDDNVRWHAAEALAEIRDPRAIDPLVAVLGDHEPGVRWNAARGLARLGKPAVVAALRALETRPLTPWLAHAAGLVLRHAPLPDPRRQIRLVVEALGHPAAGAEVPVRAAEALAALAQSD